MLPTDLKTLKNLSELCSTGTANLTDLEKLSELLSFIQVPEEADYNDLTDIDKIA